MKTTLLSLASLLFALLLCEGGLRLLNWLGAHHTSAAAATPDKPLDVAEAARYIAAMPVAPGTDRAWFTDDPPPLPNRATPDPATVARFQDYARRGFYAEQAVYVWNRHYVETAFCAPGSAFQNYPDDILVFDPPHGALHPTYRFPPNVTTAAGLVTNQFGLRGPPITLAKPPKTIRIAFVGASTTVNHHGFPFSYPERVGYWLNRFAKANHLDVHFETLNAGREGLTSEDIAEIVHDELLPLDLDLAVYYEGSNQFYWIRSLLTPAIPARPRLDPRESTIIHRVPDAIRNHLALGQLLDRSLNGFGTIGEPDKPEYRLNWPANVNDSNPAVDGTNLPAPMLTIIKNLDSIRANMNSVGGQFVLCSYVWMVKDGMRLKPGPQQFLYEQLNTSFWPFRYRDLRRLVDFENRTFRRYADDRHIPFLDIAKSMPQDPQLYVDAVHMTDTGERTKAWIVFQQLAPMLRRQIESGQLPRSPRAQLPPAPSLAAYTMPDRCHSTPPGPLYAIDGAASLATIETASPQPAKTTSTVSITSPPQQWSTAAVLPLSLPGGLRCQVYLLVRSHVLHGAIGLLVTDSAGQTEVEKIAAPSESAADIYVPVPSPDTAKSLIIQNVAEHSASGLEIERVALLASSPTPPEELIRKIDLKQVRAESGTLAPAAGKLLVTTREAQWGYAARVSLGLGRDAGAGLRVHVWLRTIEGKTGIGIVNNTGQAFLITRTVRPSPRTVEIVLSLPSPPIIGDLIVRNDAAGNTISKALIERIEIERAGLPLTSAP